MRDDARGGLRFCCAGRSFPRSCRGRLGKWPKLTIFLRSIDCSTWKTDIAHHHVLHTMAPEKKRRKQDKSTQEPGAKALRQNEAPQPSLQRLLALDKSYSTLDSQLDEAAAVLHLPSDWGSEKPNTESLDPADSRISVPRAEWLLKWILEKLKIQGANGSEARSNARAWLFLRWLVETIPDPSIMLRTSSILRIVEQALEERTPAGTGEHVDPFGLFDSSHLSSPATKIDSKKRKRDADGCHQSDGPRAEESFFQVVSQVIGVLCQRSEKSSSQQLRFRHSDQIKSVLRTDSSQAGRLLRLCLEFIHASNFPPGRVGLLTFADMKPFLRIWHLRIIPSTEDSKESANVFSTCCLISACKVIQAVSHPSNVLSHSEILTEVEKLVARHLFIPARARFFAALESSASLKSTLDLATLLGPLTTSIRPLFEEDSTNPLATLLLKSVHNLLDIGIRCSPLQSVKSKMKEAPWNQAMFAALSGSAGVQNDSSHKHNRHHTSQETENMLRVLSKHAIQLDQGDLERITLQHSGLTDEDHGQVRWSLVAAILDVDPNVFVLKPQRDAGTEEVNLLESPGYLLLNKLSSNRAVHGHLRDDGVAKQPLAWPEEQPQGTESDHDNRIQRSIVLSLLEAYAKVRDLPGFVEHWFSELESCDQATIGCSEMTQTVWATEQLVSGLSSFLESAMTPGQIHQLLNQFTNNVREAIEALQNSSAKKKKTTFDNLPKDFPANIVLLESITAAIHSEPVVDLAHETLDSLYRTLVDLVGHSAILEKAASARLFRILSRVWTLLLPLRTESVLRALGGELTLQSPCFKRLNKKCVNLIDETSESSYPVLVDGFGFLCSVAASVIHLPEYRSLSLEYLEASLAVGEKKDKEYTLNITSAYLDSQEFEATSFQLHAAYADFVSLLALHPELIRSLTDLRRRALFMRTVILAFKGYNGSIDDPGWTNAPGPVNPWYKTLRTLQQQVFLSRAHSTTDDYLEMLLTCHEAAQLHGWLLKYPASDFFEQMYLSLPAQLVPRDFRRRILDRTLVCHMEFHQNSPEQTIRDSRLAVMARFLDQQTPKARICQEPESLLGLALSYRSLHTSTAVLFGEVSRLAIQQNLKSGDENSIHGYLERLTAEFEKLKTTDTSLLFLPATLMVMKALVGPLADIQGQKKTQALQRLLDFLSNQCLSATDLLDHWPSSERTWPWKSSDVVFLLEFIGAFPLFGKTGDSHVLVQFIDRVSGQDWEVSTLLVIHQFLSKQTSVDIDAYMVLSRRIVDMINTRGTFAEYRALQASIRQRFSLLEQSDLYSFLTTAMEQMADGPDESVLERLQIAIGAVQRSPSNDAGATTESAMLPSTILPTLCGLLPRSSTPRIFHHLTSSIHMIIREKVCHAPRFRGC
jgi:hypothetical protein